MSRASNEKQPQNVVFHEDGAILLTGKQVTTKRGKCYNPSDRRNASKHFKTSPLSNRSYALILNKFGFILDS